MWLYTLSLSLHPISLLPRPCLPLPVTVPSGQVPRGLQAAGLAHLCVSGCSWPHRSCPCSRGSRRRRSPGGGRAPGHKSAHPRHSSLQRRQRWPGWRWCPTRHPPLPQCPGRYGRPPWHYPLPACSEESWPCPGAGVLTLTGSHGAVAGAEAWGTHAAVGDKGDTQVVGVGVEGRRGHIAAKSGGTRRGDSAHSRRWCPLPTAPPQSLGARGPTWMGPPEPGQDPCHRPPALRRAPHGQTGRRQCPPR